MAEKAGKVKAYADKVHTWKNVDEYLAAHDSMRTEFAGETPEFAQGCGDGVTNLKKVLDKRLAKMHKKSSRPLSEYEGIHAFVTTDRVYEEVWAPRLPPASRTVTHPARSHGPTSSTWSPPAAPPSGKCI